MGFTGLAAFGKHPSMTPKHSIGNSVKLVKGSSNPWMAIEEEKEERDKEE